MRIFNLILGDTVRLMLALTFGFCLYRLFVGRMFWYLLAGASLFLLLSLSHLAPRQRVLSRKH
ncbi:hypothetical protein [Lacticaseibacillus sharpeae]|uniref:Uncharacterized protein n=1 Tax=Lacticaseibacillus sharpeae JCM 1186 = DSM 20505 TaxID=1291052 RepID=A0A0R1ZML6_9LACO|nr:hypothetical protein [Lacticaseibacillus sharpeae]KRM56328.1 hypothetical protein FC18_GL000011 [Lacticaseibacillus sharpeae JCM 1186 = DSM 20505]